jgi:8-oxo-dGTP pyrophosphatase MutT (NUDIX family)
VASNSVDVLTRIRPVVPPALVARIEAWDRGTAPAVARRSASVLLIRPSEDELEVYLLHRHSRMAFAASMVVFPGGGLDPADTVPEPLLACAVRETYEETGVLLEPTELRPWAHWVTPEMEPRRFDTEFYVAVLPADQEARDISGETVRADWTTPSQALTAYEGGAIALMPPTLSILTELAEARTVPAVLERAAGRVVVTVRPRIEQTPDGWRFVYPKATR